MDNDKHEVSMNIGGDRKFDFTLVYEPVSNCYCFATITTEEWVKDVGEKLYNNIKDHPIDKINQELLRQDNFSATMRFDLFKKTDFGGEANRFRDYVPALVDVIQSMIGYLPPVFYVSFFSDSTDHFVNVLVEPPKGLCAFGGNLQRIKSVPDIHLA